MIKLHDFAASANCFKVRMLLSQLGLPYERVPVDIFAGDSQTDEYLARNPAGRTPLLEIDGGAIPESGAILLYLAEGTPFLPDDPIERAHVHAWMFFEQNLLEPNIGTARFWRLTGRDAERPEAFARHLEAGADALATVERGLTGREFLTAGRYTVADCALYAYTRVAHEVGCDMTAYPRVADWLERVAATEGAIDDLEPYPATAKAGAGGRSAHDRQGDASPPITPPAGRAGSGLGPPHCGRRSDLLSVAQEVRSSASSSNAATKRSQSSKVWVIDSVHSSSRPGVM